MQTPYTEQQKQEFKERFRQRRTRQLLLAAPIIGLVLLRPLLREGGKWELAGFDSAYLTGGLIAFVVGALAFSLWNWRCPACNSYLGKTVSPRYCPSCGVELSG